MKTIKKIIIPLAIGLALIISVAWKLNNNKEKMNESAAIAGLKTTVFPVTVVLPTIEKISQNFNVNGVFNPSHQLNFVSEISGRVTKVLVKNGQYVKKGQMVAQVDNEQLNIDLNLANINLEKAKTDVTKYQLMLDNNAVTKQQVEDLKIALKSSETKVATLNRQLRTTSIIAPISGTINKLSLEVGSYLSPGVSISEIIDINSLKMEVNLLDRDVVQIVAGNKINVVPDLYPNTKLKGEVISIASKSDGARKFAIEIEIQNSLQNPLKAGMTGSAYFDLEASKTSMLIPIKCIVGSLQEPKIYTTNGNSATLTPVVIGNIYNDKVEIISGLDITEKVVTSGQLNIVDGSAIQIIK